MFDPPISSSSPLPIAAVTEIRTTGSQGEISFPPLLRLGALLDSLIVDADARHEARLNGRPFGPVTGLPQLDEQLTGALAPGLHILHGSPGVGKTAFALQAAAQCGCACLYVTCEMSPLELLRRHTARVTGTYLGRLKTGELSGAQVRSLAIRAAGEAPLLAILDATEVCAPPAHVLTAAEVTRNGASVPGESRPPHLLIIIDSLHSWADAFATGEVGEYDRLNEALAALRALSKRLDCPILAIAERNRAGMKAGGQSAGAGSRKIEYGAETVLELQMDDMVAPDANGAVTVELKISKNRNGAAGRPIELRFHGALQRYTEQTP
jgi:replicative DNA helicase